MLLKEKRRNLRPILKHENSKKYSKIVWLVNNKLSKSMNLKYSKINSYPILRPQGTVLKQQGVLSPKFFKQPSCVTSVMSLYQKNINILLLRQHVKFIFFHVNGIFFS